jgi:hypothetical protein
MKYIITESQPSNLFIRRRLQNLGEHVFSTYMWLDPKRYNDYDDYFRGVVFRSLSDFLSEEVDLDYDIYNKIRDESLSFVHDIIEQKYGDKIREYYNKEMSK